MLKSRLISLVQGRELVNAEKEDEDRFAVVQDQKKRKNIKNKKLPYHMQRGGPEKEAGRGVGVQCAACVGERGTTCRNPSQNYKP